MSSRLLHTGPWSRPESDKRVACETACTLHPNELSLTNCVEDGVDGSIVETQNDGSIEGVKQRQQEISDRAAGYSLEQFHQNIRAFVGVSG